MIQITARTLSRLLKNALSPVATKSVHAKRMEPTLAPEGDPEFPVRCERRLDQALSTTSRVR
jgi:hypothetical protein